jgi:hypothetical protein
MRFNPLSDSALEEANLLPAGEYSFTITSASEKVSSKGNDMLVIELEVYDTNGKARKVTDYLVEAMQFKLKHFASAVGVLRSYDAGTLAAAELGGLSGRCTIQIEPAKGEFKAKNSVKDYIKRKVESADKTAPTTAPVAARPSVRPITEDDLGVPF